MMRDSAFAFNSPGLIRREHSHRRFLLLGLSSLLLLSILPTLGHHLPGGLEEPFASIEHVGAFCAAALRTVFSPFHYLFHVVLSMGFAYGVWDRLAAMRSLRLSIRSIDGAAPLQGTPLSDAARRAAVDVDRLVVVHGLPNPAFTAGLFRPRIYVSSDLETCLTQVELDCVIAHEGAHVRRRDPLRLSIYRFLSCLLFWMPGLKGLAADISDEAEIEADNVAARRDPLALASAILKLASASHPVSSKTAIAGFNHPDLLDRRIRRLVGEDTPLPTRVGRRSLVFASLALVLVLSSGVAAAEPPTHAASATEDKHCNHHHGSFWSHLRCSARDCHEGSAHCRHGERSVINTEQH
jgi:Zn-dependent protease with chaperone function